MPWKIGIVGMGPRGLALLDRISDTFSTVDQRVEIHIFEPSEPGCGVHYVDQPQYILANTVCSQITTFGPAKQSHLRPVGCPSLFDWARDRGYRVADPEGGQRVVQENDYLPRAILGQYLVWSYRYIVRNLPSNTSVVHHSSSVISLNQSSTLDLRLETDDGSLINVDNVFICTGHAVKHRCNATSSRFSDDDWPYPVESKIQSLPDGYRIGIEGMGLTALDVVSAATIGRGGTFDRNGEDIVYKPSGRELKIFCFSRSGIPLFARARNQKGAHWNFQPHFISIDKIDRIRQSKCLTNEQNFGQLDFDLDLLPLIQAEMELVYYTTFIRHTHGPDDAEKFAEHYLAAGPRSAVPQDYISRIPVSLRFSFSSLIEAVPASIAIDETKYRTWLLSRLKQDIAEGRLGNINSPIKAACDVLRDVRPSLRYAVDFAGLTAKSHSFFLEQFVPLMNRIAVGPPLQKLEEFCALIEAGVIDVGLGPIQTVQSDAKGRFTLRGSAGEREVDHLVTARIPLSSTLSKTRGIVHSMIESGLAKPFRNGDYSPGGIAVTETYRVIPENSKTSSQIWALGTPVEGARFYTFVLSAPGAASSPLTEAQTCVDDMMQTSHRPSTSTTLENDRAKESSLLANVSAA
ncbi:FAD/NAD(P)-binding protein [Ochrobactrum sp. S46]|nr:FAD/NAD(P)-binding protein [Ochrobactrum sp. S45]MBK0046276.1 FAD/NAD(P)-binding protein [Ochrobactrum sp. S46]